MTLAEMLYSQGFGTRRVCAGMIEKGLFSINGTSIRDPLAPSPEGQGWGFAVDGQAWQYHEKAYLLLHKPVGFECSQKPRHWPSVYSLLPAPLRQRPVKGGQNGVQCVGRLDQDTTGMLLLSDDGAFLHRMASPKHHVEKIYHAQCKHTPTAQQIDALLNGVVLDDSPTPVRGQSACITDDGQDILLTLTEGKYHQVKRMIAAVGNRVDALHRTQIGAMPLPPTLAAGQWQFLSAADLVHFNIPAH